MFGFPGQGNLGAAGSKSNHGIVSFFTVTRIPEQWIRAYPAPRCSSDLQEAAPIHKSRSILSKVGCFPPKNCCCGLFLFLRCLLTIFPPPWFYPFKVNCDSANVRSRTYRRRRLFPEHVLFLCLTPKLVARSVSRVIGPRSVCLT